MDDTVGKSGIEQAMESELRGKDGTKTISVQNGTVVSSEVTVPVQAGHTVMLTVDSTFQKDLQNILGNFIKNFDKLRDAKTEDEGLGKVTSGALVVLDTTDNSVLGLATYPTYNLNDYTKDYDKLASDETSPLLDRATVGLYRPGSTFKTITATAGLNELLLVLLLISADIPMNIRDTLTTAPALMGIFPSYRRCSIPVTSISISFPKP